MSKASQRAHDRALALLEDAWDTGSRGSLDHAVSLLTDLREQGSTEDPHRAVYLSNLGNALTTRFEQTGHSNDLDEAVRAHELAVDAGPAYGSRRAPFLSSLGGALAIRGEHVGSFDDLDKAVQACRAAVTAATAVPPPPKGLARRLFLGAVSGLRIDLTDTDQGSYLSNLGSALRLRFTLTGNIEDLDEAVRVGRQAVDATQVDDRNRATSLTSLGTSLRNRFEQNGEVSDLDEAVGVARQAMDAIPPDHPRRWLYLNNLGNALRTRFERFGRPEDLDEVVRVAGQTVNATPTGHPNRELTMNNLANALRAKAKRIGDAGDLDEAVRLYRQAVDVTPAGHSSHWRNLHNLGLVLKDRFERFGDLDDLDEAGRVARQAVNATPTGHPNRELTMNNLANVLHRRFMRIGDVDDLSQAELAYREAIDVTGPARSDRAMYLNNLGLVLQNRFKRFGDLGNLDEAVRVGQGAVEDTPIDHPDRAIYLNSLGNALRSRCGAVIESDWDAAVADLTGAVLAHRQALDATPADHPNRTIYLSGLSSALVIRFVLDEDINTLDEALSVAHQAVQAAPSEHPMLAACLTSLGNALVIRFEETDGLLDLEKAELAYREAAGVRASSLQARCSNAASWGECAAWRGDWITATIAYRHAVELLPQIAGPALSRDDREHQLTQNANLASRAAEAALQARDPMIALGLLEQGRGVLLAQALEARDDLTPLHEQHPDLAARYTRVRDALLGQPGDTPRGGTTHTGSDLDAAVERRRLDAERLRLLADIRTLPGFATFLLPPSARELGVLAAQGPIVAIILTATGGTALLCTSHSDGHGNLTGHVRTVELPTANEAAVLEQVELFRLAHQPLAFGRNEKLRVVLGWLWEHITEPILRRLGHDTTYLADAPKQLPRMWWMPAGPLVLLPLHAAGLYPSAEDATAGARPWGVMDLVVSSYTPTLRALQRARARPARDVDGCRPLIVGVGTTVERNGTSYPPLAFTLAEVERVREILAAEDPVLVNDQATRAHVLSRLPGADIAHFACHADTDPANPTTSCLALYDQDLSVTDLTRLHLTDARLAYLSACATAHSGTTLLDEAIHIAGAFHLAGFRHVIATLWPIGDEFAVNITESIYTSMRGDPRLAAHAVHDAVVPIYMQYPAEPGRWAAHIHIGP